AFIAESSKVVLSRPTYPMFTVLTEMAGGALHAVPSIDLRLDREGFLEQSRDAQLTWLSNPNNPTGELQPLDFVEELAAGSHGVVVIDEGAHLPAELARLGFEVRDSAANFLLVRTGRQAASMLLRDGLVVRTFPATSPLADFTRITVRRPEENARLLSALKGSLTPH